VAQADAVHGAGIPSVVVPLLSARSRKLWPSADPARLGPPDGPDCDDAAVGAPAASGAGFVAASVSAVSTQYVYGTVGSAALAPAATPSDQLEPRPRYLSVAPDPQASAGGHYGSIPRIQAQSVESGLAAMGLRAPGRAGPQEPDHGPEPEPEPEPEREREPEADPDPPFARWAEPEPEPVVSDPQFRLSDVLPPAPAADLAPAPTPVEEAQILRLHPSAPPTRLPSGAPTAPFVPKPSAEPAAPTSVQNGSAHATPTVIASNAAHPRPAPAAAPRAGDAPEPDPDEDPREILRAATQKAVDRLVRPEPVAPRAVPTPAAWAAVPNPATSAAVPTPAAWAAVPTAAAWAAVPTATAWAAVPPTTASASVRSVASPPAPVAPPEVPRTHRPSIAELTRQVERAVNHAALAESYRREIADKAREVAAQILADSVAKAQHTTDRAAAERESLLAAAKAEADRLQSDSQAAAEQLLSDSRTEAERLIADARAERDQQITQAKGRSESLIARAEAELRRRIRRIAELTEGITDVAEATLGSLASGTLTGTQLAQFITTLGTVTERALARIEFEFAPVEPELGERAAELRIDADDRADPST
jgi:hypothetical protein